MRKLTFFLFSLMVFSVFVFSYQQDEYYDYSYARLNYVKGDVYIQRAEDLGYEEGTVNLPLVEGDKLGTRDGRAEIHFGKKNYLRIDRFTQIDIARLPKEGDDFISLHVLSGNIFLRVNLLDRERDFEVHTPDGSFYVLEQGLYRLEVSENQETALYVLEGRMEAAGEEGSELVRGGESLIASNGYFPYGPEYAHSKYEDSFSEWNRGRDIFHNRHVRRTYLPVELSAYESELAYYGRWVYERPYGYVWIPQVYHYSWRPYYNGRWVWYPLIGWTWVSHEPWGWCVSHYGRWHWRVGLGWYWIPTRRWSPAWVHWYRGYDYVGWCPLSYYGRPVVIVNNRFYGRYHDRYYPLNSRALTVVHKKQLHARQVSKVALSKSSVSQLGKISLSSKQPNGRSVVNRSTLKSSGAAKALSRSSVRQVGKTYVSGKSIRSRSKSSVTRTTKSTVKTPISGKISKSGLSSSGRIKTTRSRSPSRATSSSRSTLTKRSVQTTNKSRPSRARTKSKIKTYPSRNRVSRVSTRSSSPRKRTAAPSRNTRTIRSHSSRGSSHSKIKKYSSQPSNPVRNRSSATKSIQRSSRARTSTAYKPFIKRYTSSRSSYRSPSSANRSSKSYRSPYSSSRRIRAPSKSRISSSSSIKTIRNKARFSPSRSSSKVRSFSRNSASSSRSRISSSRSKRSFRSNKSLSRSRVSRSSSARASRSSSRSKSVKKVKKK